MRKAPDSSDKFSKYPDLPLGNESRKRRPQEGPLRTISLTKKKNLDFFWPKSLLRATFLPQDFIDNLNLDQQINF